MDKVKELMKAFDEADISKMKIETDDMKLELEKEVVNQPVKEVHAADKNVDRKIEKSGEAVCSPLVGTYYASPSPEAAPFVNEGDAVKKGQTLCIIEAMKVMNEIKAPKDGVISEIYVHTEDLVEYNQPLMMIEEKHV